MNISNRYSHLERRQRGLTLVELMVSLALSLVLMVGALQLFSGSKESYRLSDSLAGIQENGRYALEILARDIRQAGFTGCIAAPGLGNVLDFDPMPWQFDFARPVFGYEGSDDEVSPSVAGAGQPGEPWNEAEADAIHVLFGDADASMTIIGPDTLDPDPAVALRAALEVAAVPPALQEGQIMLVTDCQKAALFRLTDITDPAPGKKGLEHAAGGDEPANCSDFLHDNCPVGTAPNVLSPYLKDRSRTLPLRVSSYFVGNTQREDPLGNPIPALYRQSLGPGGLRPIEELVEGVSDLQIRYGLAPVGSRSADRYLEAHQLNPGLNPGDDDDDWARVVSVRIDLTIQSTQGVEAVQPPEEEPRPFEQTFSTTIALRNRTL